MEALRLAFEEILDREQQPANFAGRMQFLGDLARQRHGARLAHLDAATGQHDVVVVVLAGLVSTWPLRTITAATR